MAPIPRWRFLVYLVLIASLTYALVVAASHQSARHAFQGRRVQSEQGSLQGEGAQREPSSASLPSAQKTTAPSDVDEDDALLELNSLSNDDAGPPSEEKRAAMTPTPAVTPASAAQSDDGMIYGARDDARSIFSGAQQPEPGLFGDGFIGGARSNSGGMGGGAGDPMQPDPTAPPNDSGDGWVSGQARGYTMIYGLQPQARAVVEANVNALLSARIREPYIGVLIDGTFTQDFDYLKSVVARLSDERNLTLVLYLTNGPTQRLGTPQQVAAPFLGIPPAAFRARIIFETDLRTQFSALAAQARDIFQYSRQQNAANQHFVSVMLEDTLDVDAYRSMRQLAAQQLDDLAGFIRSTCVGCGNPRDRVDDRLAADTAGDPREEHSLDRFNELRRGDGFALDGVGFQYPGEVSPKGISSDRLKQLVADGYAKGLRFCGLWRHNWQGAELSSKDNQHPSLRNYVPSTPEQEAFEIEILRQGLIPEPTDDDEQDSQVIMR